jgi:serine/threonine-protein phosphatase 2A regulatory subunit B''
MTTTAKQSSSSTDVRGSSPASSNFEAAEDIESIAKQISDHAEAIYQEWKARGLAPTEILKCHPETDSSFNRTLSPKSSPTTPQSSSRTILDHHSKPITPELLAKAPDLSSTNLEHLVNSFVNEDKARIAAQRCDSPSGNSIKFALKKFENLGEQSPLPVSNPPSYSSNAKSYSSPQKQDIINKTNSTLTNNNNLNYLNKNESSQQPHHVPDVLKDTIEKSSKRQKPETPVKPEHLLNHVPTWPLKHRQKSDMKTPVDKKLSSGPSSSSPKSPSIDVLDEVSREEEKLINALKTGTVLSNECLPEVIKSSLNEYKSQAEQQLNGISVAIKENNRNDQQSEAHSVAQSQPTQLPQKPNHTPIYVPHKEEQSKGFSSFARVATTRIPSRNDPKTDDKKFELKSVPSPVRPFLSRGSVAERVLIFEKCPEKTPMRQTTEKPKIQVSGFCWC